MPDQGRAIWLLALTAGLLTTDPLFAQVADPNDFFESKVRPVLVEHCIACHGEKKQEAGLRLDLASSARAGGDAGPVITPGKPEESPFLDVLRHDGPVKMPPKAKLPDNVIQNLETWIKLGAPWPEEKAGQPASGTKSPLEHWAFQPVKKPALPAVASPANWAANPIDLFILARLESAKLSPSPAADRRTMLRRLSFDVTGLPPTAAELDDFLNDKSSDDLAWARQVDRVLASPRLGERWGRHWLDVARYADTKGYVFFEDAAFPWAWTYRDYVISAFNEDRPYTQFVTDQLAADLAEPPGDARDLRALGLLTVGAGS